MGLFDKFRKNKDDDATQVNEKTVATKTQKVSAGDGGGGDGGGGGGGLDTKKKIIYGVVVLAVVGLVVEGELNKGNSGEETVQQSKPKKRQRPKKKKKKPAKKVAKAKPTAVPTAIPTPVPTAEPTAPPAVVEKPVKPVKPKVEDKPKETTSSGQLDKETLDQFKKELTNKPDLTSEIPGVGGGVGKEEKIDDLVIQDIVLDEMEMENKKKAKEVVFTPPPDYEKIGRGLVYNCVNTHWACVNRASYYQCRNNKKWNSKEGKKVQCVDFEVYASINDCALAQQKKVDGIEDVTSCK